MLNTGQVYKCKIKFLSMIPEREVFVTFTGVSGSFYQFTYLSPDPGGQLLIANPLETLINLQPVSVKVNIESCEPATITDPEYTGNPDIDLPESDDDDDLTYSDRISFFGDGDN